MAAAVPLTCGVSVSGGSGARIRVGAGLPGRRTAGRDGAAGQSASRNDATAGSPRPMPSPGHLPGRPPHRHAASWPPTVSASPHRTPTPAAPPREPRRHRRDRSRCTSRTGSAPVPLSRLEPPCRKSVTQPARSPVSRHQGCSAGVSPLRDVRHEHLASPIVNAAMSVPSRPPATEP